MIEISLNSLYCETFKNFSEQISKFSVQTFQSLNQIIKLKLNDPNLSKDVSSIEILYKIMSNVLKKEIFEMNKVTLDAAQSNGLNSLVLDNILMFISLTDSIEDKNVQNIIETANKKFQIIEKVLLISFINEGINFNRIVDQVITIYTY